jgi:hypothetical protein
VTVEIRSRRSTVVVNDRRPRQDITRRDNTTQVTRVDSPVEVGSNIGRRGARGAPGGSIPAIAWSFGDAAGTVWTPESDGVLVGVRLAVEVALNGTAPTIMVGTLTQPDAAMAAGDNDPSSQGEYETTPDLRMTAGTPLRMAITPNVSNAGSGALYLDFLPD